MTGTGVLKLLGGVRAAVFAGVAAALLIAACVQTWRLHAAETDVAKLQAAAADWRAAQSTNLGTIKSLRDYIANQVEARRLERAAQAKAVARAEKAARAVEALLERRTNELEKIYARNPDAARWAASGIPADVLRGLPGSDAD